MGCWGIQQVEGLQVRNFPSKIYYQSHPLQQKLNQLILVQKDIGELQADLCDFIVEIRKENGEQYPSSSMYDLISGLSLYLEREHGFTNKLVSEAFRAVRNTLDNVMKERTTEGVGEA